MFSCIHCGQAALEVLWYGSGSKIAVLFFLLLLLLLLLPPGKPFYIQVAPIGCHDACYVDEDFNGYLTPPLPAPRHAKLYAEVNLPLRPNHNEEDVSDKPAWLQAVPK